LTSARAWGWLAHLHAGGSTPWLAWQGDAEPAGRFPGAQQLELLRRLNEVQPARPELVDRVLASAAPGRGHQDLALVGDEERQFGAAPVDPAAMPVAELVRLASGVLADLVVDRPEPPTPEQRGGFLRPRYLLRGDPWLGRAARAQLGAQGLPPGGRLRPRALVVLAPVDDYCADLWAGWSISGTVPRWTSWLDRLDHRLPPRADPVATAARLAARTSPGRVHVCLGLTSVAELLGAELTAPPPPSHAALEAIRQVKAVLRVAVGEPGARALVDSTLVPWLSEGDDAALPRPGVPRRHQPWLRAEAARWRAELGQYAVHGGSLNELAPAEPVRTQEPHDDEVLHVMLRTLLQTQQS